MSNSGPGVQGAPHVLVSVPALKVVLAALRDGTLAQRETAAELLEAGLPVIIAATHLTEDV